MVTTGLEFLGSHALCVDSTGGIVRRVIVYTSELYVHTLMCTAQITSQDIDRNVSDQTTQTVQGLRVGLACRTQSTAPWAVST
jgi:hypothetical protein